ncbi:hypothetical protein FQN53_008870 [Emmonsiellopsis sp. PD_33]|nr:hypothetical protein FQN53_008870 [Emmonsiellopsis sp. PD_33]
MTRSPTPPAQRSIASSASAVSPSIKRSTPGPAIQSVPRLALPREKPAAWVRIIEDAEHKSGAGDSHNSLKRSTKEDLAGLETSICSIIDDDGGKCGFYDYGLQLENGWWNVTLPGWRRYKTVVPYGLLKFLKERC